MTFIIVDMGMESSMLRLSPLPAERATIVTTTIAAAPATSAGRARVGLLPLRPAGSGSDP